MTARGACPRPRGSPCVVLPYAVADGARNMAVDEAMLELAAGGSTLLRFYGWEPWCLSLGRHQEAPERLLGRSREDLRPGVDAVRRPTGGRSVFHGPEITYAFACPARAWGGPRAVLRTVHRALAEGLRSVGAPLDAVQDDDAEANSAEAARISAASCFRDPAPGELTARGRKLVGSAQCRRQGGLLQHGSILLENRQAMANLEHSEGATRRPERLAQASAIGLHETLAATPAVPSIVRGLEVAFTCEFGPPASPATVATALDRAAARYVSKHRSATRLWHSRGPHRSPCLAEP